jgi:beta-N-acetylhexosaminidase
MGRLALRDPEAGRRAAWLTARLIAADLFDLRINVDCLPVLDVASDGMHAVIGDRSYGRDAGLVALLGRATATGLLDGGVLPVMKHIPGHGRAGADSHLSLPTVDAGSAELQLDFAPFRQLRDLPMAMTAHVLYTALDADRPATTSPGIISQVIREEIGFDGLLMSDDVSMGALEGGIGERTGAAIAAGCDIALHCNGDMDEMRAVAAAVPALSGRAAVRAGAALARLHPPEALDRDAARAELDALIAPALA